MRGTRPRRTPAIDILCVDPLSIAVRKQAALVAGTDLAVMILGETGTGKECFARFIHQESGRTGPFVAVNCATFPPALAQAQLFGHEAGAFAGAARGRAGWFEAAQGGTLFLDEVGELSPAVQAGLLRAIQERQIARIGSTQMREIDVRIISASHVDLWDAIGRKNFRADLFHRLSAARLTLPPLRQRPHDISALAERFLQQYSARLGVATGRFSQQTRAALSLYRWPGNVRELENAVYRAVLLRQGAEIEFADLGIADPGTDVERILGLIGESAALSNGTVDLCRDAVASYARDASPSVDGLRDAVDVLVRADHSKVFELVESELVGMTYRHCHGNQIHGARMLGVSRSVIRTLFKRHGYLERSLPRQREIHDGA